MEQCDIYSSSRVMENVMYITVPDSRNNAISVFCEKGLFFGSKSLFWVCFRSVFSMKMGLFWVCFFEIWVCFINWLHCTPFSSSPPTATPLFFIPRPHPPSNNKGTQSTGSLFYSRYLGRKIGNDFPSKIWMIVLSLTPCNHFTVTLRQPRSVWQAGPRA